MSTKLHKRLKGTPRRSQTPRTNFRSTLAALEVIHNSELCELHSEVLRLRKLLPLGKGGSLGIGPATPRNVAQPCSHAEPRWDDLVQGKGDDEDILERSVVDQLPVGQDRDDARWNATGEQNGSHAMNDRSVTWCSGDRQDEQNASDVMCDRSVTWCTGDVARSPTTQSPHSPSTPKARRKVLVRSESIISEQEDAEKRSRAELAAEEHVRRKGEVESIVSMCKATTFGGLSHRLHSPDLSERYCPLLGHIVRSSIFEMIVAAAIVSNSICLGVRLDLALTSPEPEHHIFEVLEYFYTIFFLLELAARLAVHGLGMFCAFKTMHWYFLDLFVVVASLMEIFLDSSSQVLSNTRMFRLARVVRVIKVLRMARLVQFVRALRTLVLSIVHSMKSVFWALVMLLMIIYGFGLVFAQLISSEIHTRETVSPALILYWGTLPRSLFTLYKSISAGIDWQDAIVPLAAVDDSLVVLFVVYISFTVFAVLNVITGVFCEAAIQSAREDNDMLVHQHLSEREKFTQGILALFGVEGNVGQELLISYQEFEKVLKDPLTKARLAAMQLDTNDAWELFKLLDTDDVALIDVEDFASGCLRLKGMAKALDMAKLSYETKSRQRRIQTYIASIDAKLETLKSALENQHG